MFFLIDKPLGISSFDAIRSLRKTLGIKKMWHSGTLDPLATGCLLIATENSTKLLPLLEKAKKEYIFTVHLDGKSESLDSGTAIYPVDITYKKNKTEQELRSFVLSQTKQIPPRYSALHVEGERAYDLARKWEIFNLPERSITVEDAEIIELTRTYITLRIIISSGWYIRSFAPLIASFFWINGWYISALRRTKIYTEYGILAIAEATSLEDPLSISYSKLFHTIPTVEIGASEYDTLRLGKTLNFSWQKTPEWDTHIFLKYTYKNYISLCKLQGWIVTIMRNNV